LRFVVIVLPLLPHDLCPTHAPAYPSGLDVRAIQGSRCKCVYCRRERGRRAQHKHSQL